MAKFIPQLHVSARTREIEKIFQDNKAGIQADVESLELSMQALAAKYKVNDRNVRRWCERLGVDVVQRNVERRKQGKEAQRGYTHKGSTKQDKPQAHKLAGLW